MIQYTESNSLFRTKARDLVRNTKRSFGSIKEVVSAAGNIDRLIKKGRKR